MNRKQTHNITKEDILRGWAQCNTFVLYNKHLQMIKIINKENR